MRYPLTPLCHPILSGSLRICGSSILILCIAVVWFLVIVCLKVAGQKRVGFLAGHIEWREMKPEFESGSNRTLSAIPEEEERNETELNNEEFPAPNEETEAFLATPLVISNTIFDEREYAREEKKFHRKVFGVRAAFVISGICVIISGGLFYGKGVASFDDSLNTVRVGIDVSKFTTYYVVFFLFQVHSLEHVYPPNFLTACSKHCK